MKPVELVNNMGLKELTSMLWDMKEKANRYYTYLDICNDFDQPVSLAVKTHLTIMLEDADRINHFDERVCNHNHYDNCIYWINAALEKCKNMDIKHN